jgi:phospholipid/cholesterol/gamma-HCH transport system permease protein
MITVLGHHLIVGSSAMLDFFELFIQTLRTLLTTRLRIDVFFRQFYFVANQSAPVVVFCVCFAAVVTIIEAAYHMKIVVGDVSMVPGFAALFILRELGVVIAALLVTSRVGAGIAAEVGSMTITEQVDALKMLGIDPIQYLVVPRFVACVVGCMILSVIANGVCLVGAMLVSEQVIGYSAGEFVMSMRRFVDFQDILFPMLKGAAFGAAIPLISCYFGFRCKSGAEGVGLATTNSVVVASIAIIFLDFVLGYTLSHFY